MKFCTETVKDLEKYFRGTFVKFSGMRGVFSDGTECSPAEELVHSVDTITQQFIKGKRFENGETVPYQFMLYSEKDVPAPEIEYILPRKSYFNTKKGACLLMRIPARQYRRGVCNDNTQILLLTQNGGFVNQGTSLELLDEYVKKQAFEHFHESGMSYAVSRRIAVAAHGGVYVDQCLAGSINYAKQQINVIPLFAPELQQVLKDNGQPGWSVSLPESPKSAKKSASMPLEF